LLVSEVPPGLVLAFAALFGACWGSFFNVAIYRWPRDLSVVRPPSSCPGCGAPVAARFNLPIVGYFILRGRTACCGAPLSIRYPIVEALSAVLCVAIVQRFLLGAPEDTTLLRAGFIALSYFAFVGALVIATFVDLEFMEIPDEVSLPGAALGLATAVVRDPTNIADMALGAGFGFLVVQVVFVWAYELMTGRRGMGEGDAKLLLMIGAFLGYQGVLFSVFVGAAQGLIAFVVGRLVGAGAGLTKPDGVAAGEPGSGSAARELGADDAVSGVHAPATASRAEPVADAATSGAHARIAPRTFHVGQADLAADELDDEPEPSYWGHLKLPFGPFLALGALEFLFFGPAAIELWFSWIAG
jgi:leader peptidase (prepilin peptidase)/N-methyltransferase